MDDSTEGFLEGAIETSKETSGGDDGFLDGAFEEAEEDDSFLSGAFEEETEEKEISYQPTVHYKSSEDMSEIENESVSLIVTSPPYNADWAYGSHDDQLDYQTEYLPMLARVFTECWRVLRPGGRMCVNVPTLLRGGASGGQAILSDIDTMLNEKVSLWGVSYPSHYEDDSGNLKAIEKCMSETSFVHREWVTWNKGFNDAGMAPNGSYPRPWGILLNNMHEGVSIYQKPGERDVSTIDDERIEESKINKWSDDLCDDVWDISPEGWTPDYAEDEGVPPFPEELVKRCIALWTYKEDTVLDPFLGRGTTLKVAKEMDRHSVGFEIREEMKKDIEEYIRMNETSFDDWL